MIRPATPDDIPRIVALIRELAEYEKLAHEAVATEADLHDALFGPEPVAKVLIAEEEGRTVGFALSFRTFSTFLGRPGIYLEDLYVRPEARGRGFGKALIETLARECAEKNYGRLEWSVLDWNAPSIEFYRRLGAEPRDGWTVMRLSGDALANPTPETGVVTPA